MPATNWHVMEDLIGIGSAIAAELSSRGFHYAESLLKFNRRNIASSLEPVTGLTRDNLMLDYCLQARLLRLPDMTPQIGHALLQEGFDYSRLTYTPTDDVVTLLNNSGFTVTDHQVLQWQLDASKRRYSSTITIKVTDESGQPVSDASVYVDDPALTGDGLSWHWRSNQYGQALVEYLSPGYHELVIQKDNKFQQHFVTVAHCQYLSLTSSLNRDAHNGVVHDEAVDGPLMDDGATIRVNVDETDLVDGDILEVTELDSTAVRLTRILRKKKGTNWYIESINIPLNRISFAPEHHDLVINQNGQFVKKDGTKTSVRMALRKQHLIDEFANSLGG